MKLLAISALLVATASAALQGYTLPTPSGLTSGTGFATGGTVPSSGTIHSTNAGHSTTTVQSSVGGSSAGDNHGFNAAHGSQTSSAAHSATGNEFTSAGVSSQGSTTLSTGLGVSTGGGFASSTELNSGISVVSTGSGITSGDGSSETHCKDGEIRHVDGSCIVPEITRKVYVVSVPKQSPQPSDSLPDIPPPRVDHNILFVRLPEGGVGPDPIVVPPPRQNNIVYVLSKNSQNGQRVIEVPAPPPSEPEIYFVNYDDGENPTLPGGVDLETALGSAVEANGQVFVDGSGNNFVDTGISAVSNIGNVAESGVGSLISVNTGDSGLTSQGNQIGVTTVGNTYTTSSSSIASTPSSISAGGSFQSGNISQNPQGASSSAFGLGTTGFQSGGISQGSQFTVTTTGNTRTPSPARPTPSGLYAAP
ncbi:uncharacterized protein LOC122257995 [Penaeus japonicus]|uniref:uncharacterized protein LOC122257995 n=1 Tax=Penaeus japonicus TaxID=27405 RepID=UPI001C712956|nr:uncharacterized protein LOC122257995 [Penaeus japonicus]